MRDQGWRVRKGLPRGLGSSLGCARATVVLPGALFVGTDMPEGAYGTAFVSLLDGADF